MAVYTEMTYASWLSAKLEAIAQEQGLRWKRAHVETKSAGMAKRADIILSTDTRDELVIEVKRPENGADNPFSQPVVAQAAGYARAHGMQFFVTHNVQAVAVWRLGSNLPEDQAFISTVETVQEYESQESQILDGWRALLPRLESLVATGRKLLPLETTFAEMVGQHVESIVGSTNMVAATAMRVVTDAGYRKKFDSWLASRGRDAPQTDNEAHVEASVFCKQVLYAWCNQLLFYRAIQQRYELDPLSVEGLTTVEEFATAIDKRFAQAMKATGDFETVFVPPAPMLPVCDAASTRKIVALARNLDYYDFENISYDVLGGLFQRLIVQRERHLMGQFFTPTPLADLIIASCGGEGAKYLDPACGSGTFLIRSYSRIKAEEGLGHLQILPRIWGFDLAQYPAHLATVNLALQDLGETNNHPNVSRRDFFTVEGPKDTLAIDYAKNLIGYGVKRKASKTDIVGLGVEQRTVEVPTFSAIVGNPPYTRFQELNQGEFGKGYRERIRAQLESHGLKPIPPSECGIYGYFLLHSRLFLSKNGRLGFVLLRQWIDVEYGQDLKRFILNNFRIVMAVESDAERWFQDAQMLPMFLVLERCDKAADRASHTARFVRLDTTLADITGFVEDMDGIQQARYWEHLARAAAWLSGSSSGPEPSWASKVHIIEVAQKDLDPNGKWSHYFRPTPVFDRVASTVALTNAENIGAEFSYGTISGAVQFFVLTDTKNPWQAETRGKIVVLNGPNGPAFVIPIQFVHPYVNKFRDLNSYELDSPPDLLFSCRLGKSDLIKHEPDPLRGQPLAIAENGSIDIRKKEKTLADFMGLKGGARAAVMHRGPLGYVEWGEMTIHSVKGHPDLVAISELSAPRTRKPWYNVPLDPPPQYLLPTLVLQRPSVIMNRAACHNSQNVYGLRLDFTKLPAPVRKRLATAAKERGVTPEELYARAGSAILNSAYMALAIDRAGRYVENRDYSIGVKLELQEWRKVKLPNLAALDAGRIADLADLYMEIKGSGPMQMDARLADVAHRKLDKYVATQVLGLSASDAKELLAEVRLLYDSRKAP